METSGIRSMRTVFLWLAWIFAGAIVVQVFLAGLALFSDSAEWAVHSGFARYFSVLPVLMLILSIVARLPAPLRIQSAALVGMIVLMFISAIYSSKIGFLSALHPVIAVFLFFRTMAVVRQTRELN